MKINNIKPNLRQFLTDKINTQKKNIQKYSVSNQNKDLISQINSHTNSNKNIGKFSLLNSIMDKDSKKKSKLINENNANINYNFNNNSFLKEAQNEFNKFRKSKTTEKTNGNNILVHQENPNNKNKKIMIKQNTGNTKKYNLSVSKIPKYDNSAFNQVIKYYTIKSESKTIQIEELSTYLRPIRNILGFANKIKTQNNVSSSININNHFGFKNKNFLNKNNSKENLDEKNDVNESIKNKDDKNINSSNKKNNMEEDKKEINYGKEKKNQNNINLNLNNNIMNNKSNNISNNISTDNKNEISNNINLNNLNNKINTSLIKNCVFNNNISHTQRSNKFTPVPFNIKIDKINNANAPNINNIKNKNLNDSNNKDINNNININNTIMNSKNVSESETQISTNNNNINNNISQTQAFYQFRPRKMNLPKTGINLSSMQFKNKILQNILNKRKQKKEK